MKQSFSSEFSAISGRTSRTSYPRASVIDEVRAPIGNPEHLVQPHQDHVHPPDAARPMSSCLHGMESLVPTASPDGWIRARSWGRRTCC